MASLIKPAPIGKLPASNLKNVLLPSTCLSSTRIGALNMLSAMRSSVQSDTKNSLGSSKQLSQLKTKLTSAATAGALARIVPQASSAAVESTQQQPPLTALTSVDLEERLHDIVATEIEAAITVAVRNAMEKEMAGVEEAVSNALKNDRNSMDLRANVNTLVAVIGIVIFERGVWTAWDVCFGDSAWSEVVSVGIGLGILTAIRVFNIPLAEWRKP